MTPPFNIFSWFLLPIYHCRDRKNLESFNSKVSKCTYFPLACIFTLFFFISCLVLTPFAWIKVVVHKCLLSKRTGQGQFVLEAILYFFFGLPLLIVTALVDCKWFF